MACFIKSLMSGSFFTVSTEQNLRAAGFSLNLSGRNRRACLCEPDLALNPGSANNVPWDLGQVACSLSLDVSFFI